MLRKFFAEKAFYKKIIRLLLPILAQNAITTFVGMLDNLMVGNINQVQMTGVSIANTLLFVFNLVIFGCVSGASIYGAQYAGKNDWEGLRYTLRFKLLSGLLLTVLSILLFLFGGNWLIHQFLLGEGSVEDALASLQYGSQYLRVILISLIPYTVVQCYASSLRETGKVMLPMAASMIAVGVNFVLNGILIFGLLGAPRLESLGAAIATVVSRFVEFGIVVIATHRSPVKHPFIRGLYSSFRVPMNLVGKIISRGFPLLINETLWSVGTAYLNQCYSLRGLDVVAANTINSTFANVFNVVFLSIGAAISIIIGQMLGKGETDTVYGRAIQLITFSVLSSVVVGLLFAGFAVFLPNLYEVEDSIRMLATRMMWITAASFPLDAFANAMYFTLRSGGQVAITMIFDSGFTVAVNVPVAMILSNFTDLPILPLYAVVLSLYVLKDLIGYFLFRRKKWIRNIINSPEKEAVHE